MSVLVPASTAEHPGVRSRYDRTRRSESNARISRLPSILDAVRCRIADNVIARDVRDVFRQARAANRRVMIAPDRSVIHRFVSQCYRILPLRRRMDTKFFFFFSFIFTRCEDIPRYWIRYHFLVINFFFLTQNKYVSFTRHVHLCFKKLSFLKKFFVITAQYSICDRPWSKLSGLRSGQERFLETPCKNSREWVTESKRAFFACPVLLRGIRN